MPENRFHGGSLVAKVLKAYDVTHLYTLTGGHISPILVASEQLGIKIIDTRSETNAVFAADAYSRLSGKVGVAVVTAGPGVTNSITAIKNAQFAESALVLIGGATATMLEGRGALQDIDQFSLMKSTTKWLTSIRKVKEISPKLTKAFQITSAGVPGPVFVEIPVDVLYPKKIVRKWYDVMNKPGKSIFSKTVQWYVNRHFDKLFEDPNQSQIPEIIYYESSGFSGRFPRAVIEQLRKAQRPVILASSQLVSKPQIIEDIVKSLESLDIPVYVSGMARGLLGKGHPLHFKHKRSLVLKQADLILLLGVSLDFRLGYGSKLNRNATVISVNLSRDALKMNKFIRKLDQSYQQHPGDFIIRLAAKIRSDLPDYNKWYQTIKKLNDERENEIKDMASQSVKPHGYVNPLKICEAVEENLQDNAIIVNDGGDFIATFSYVANPRGPLQWLDPGPFGTLGVGSGFAIGAKSVHPDAPVWIIFGDGAVGFSLSEFDSFVRHNLPVIAIVGNDASWQQIARGQIEVFNTDLATKLDYTDYHKVVEGFGAKGLLIDSEDKIQKTLQEAIKLYQQGYSVLVNVLIGKSEFRKGSISV